MRPKSQLAAVRSLIERDPDAVGLIDRGNVISVTDAPDGFGGTTTTETVIASNVPMLYEFAAYGNAQVGGHSLAHVTHDIFILADATTRTIGPHHKIVVLERDDIPEFVFEQPTQLEETFGPLVHLGAAKH